VENNKASKKKEKRKNIVLNGGFEPPPHSRVPAETAVSGGGFFDSVAHFNT